MDVADVDATQDFVVGVDDDEVQGGALLVLANAPGKAFIEVSEVFFTAVTNSLGEEASVIPLEALQRLWSMTRNSNRVVAFTSEIQPECGAPTNRISELVSCLVQEGDERVEINFQLLHCY